MSVTAVQAGIPLIKTTLGLLAATAKDTSKQVQEAAKEFESLLVGQLLKQSRETLGKEGGFFGTDKSDTYGALFDFFLGKHLADSGGFGLAGTIERQLSMNRQR
jgi:flagellar protein FlgJ